MKILILTATIGQGHNAVAASLQREFDRREIPCKTVDLYETVSPTLKKIVAQGYLWSIRSVVHTRSIGVKYYSAMEKTYRPAKDHGITALFPKAIAAELRKVFDAYGPDVIICTQVYCAHSLNLMKQLGWLDVPTIAVLTDFTVQAHWEGTKNVDYIAVPSLDLSYQLAQRKIAPERVIETGIPINPDFMHRTDKQEARKILGLRADCKTLLVMGGSMGYGKMDRTIKRLDRLPLDFQMILVCGNNSALLRKIQRISFKKQVKIFGFCKKIPLVMDAADVVITKPGGLSLSEALAKNLPMILTGAIPGMEDRNAEFMVNHGLALVPSKTFSIAEAVHILFSSPVLSHQMAQTTTLYAHADATGRLCDFAQSLVVS